MTRQLCEQCESDKGVAWDHQWLGYLCLSCAEEIAEVAEIEGNGQALPDDRPLPERVVERAPAFR